MTPPDPIDRGALVGAYRKMLLARRVDERAAQLQRTGRIAHHSSSIGLEAVAVGAVAALGDDDWIFPSYRELAVALARGVAAERVFDQLFGTARDVARGRRRPSLLSARDVRIASASALLGTQLTHAVGAAWAAKMRGDAVVAITFFGEAAADSAPFHNALNFAGAGKVPAVFVGAERSGRLDPGLEARGVAYGVPVTACAADDWQAVHEAVAAAKARALAGEGPTLIVCHVGDGDPVEQTQSALRGAHGWSDDEQQSLEDELATLIEDAESRAAAAGSTPRGDLFDEVYGETPWHLVEQRAALEATPRAPDPTA